MRSLEGICVRFVIIPISSSVRDFQSTAQSRVLQSIAEYCGVVQSEMGSQRRKGEGESEVGVGSEAEEGEEVQDGKVWKAKRTLRKSV